jgi:hypothetical protein
MAENQKLKVADLPQDEQDKLLNEARELNIKGLVHTWNVETLQKKINEAKAKQTPAADEQTPAADEQTPATDEQTPAADEQTPAADEQTPAADEQTPATDEQAPATPKIEKGKEQAYIKEPEVKPLKVKICHICRSKVINGKCTGCGFELK